jgi:hypothetical protein
MCVSMCIYTAMYGRSNQSFVFVKNASEMKPNFRNKLFNVGFLTWK